MKILSPKYDIIFKSIFTDPEAPEILQGFISEALGVDYNSIKSIVLNPNEVHIDSEDEKFSRLDLLADVDGRKVNIEIQCANQMDFVDRSLYYWSKIYGAQLKAGMPYENLPEVVCINITDFKVFNQHDDYSSTFEIYDMQHQTKLTNKFKTIYFELPKALERGHHLSDTGMDGWMRFFNADSEEDLKMLERTMSEPIKKAVVTLRKLSDDEILQEKIRLTEKAQHDRASLLLTARREGHAEGRAEGIDEGIKIAFVSMVKNGANPIQAALLINHDVHDFEDVLYQLEKEYPKFHADDYLNPPEEEGAEEFEM